MVGENSLQNQQINHQQRERVDSDATDERLKKFSCLELQKLAKFYSLLYRWRDQIHNIENKLKPFQFFTLSLQNEVHPSEIRWYFERKSEWGREKRDNYIWDERGAVEGIDKDCNWGCIYKSKRRSSLVIL